MKVQDYIRKPKLTVGWREWVALPQLGIPAIKAKIDSGARTSALHTYEHEIFEKNGEQFVRFALHPMQRKTKLSITCEAKVVGHRHIRNSGGYQEERLVIRSTIQLLDRTWPIELTLANREDMLFRMLLGRTAMRNRLIIDPSRSFLTGRKLAKAYSQKP